MNRSLILLSHVQQYEGALDRGFTQKREETDIDFTEKSDSKKDLYETICWNVCKEAASCLHKGFKKFFGGKIMMCSQVIDQLKACSSEKYKANVIKLGIPEQNSLGVSTADVRKIAKELGKSSELAFALWKSGYHEARLLAVLLLEKKSVSNDLIEQWMNDVVSWDLCDHICKNLIIKLPNYDEFIQKWSVCTGYHLRAVFTLIASAAIHDKKLSEDKIEEYLEIIKECSVNSHEHVKKAVSWALREIGKIDETNNEKALIVANELKLSTNKTQAWIGKDVLKEIENVVKVEGRKRLISTNSNMGKEV